MESRHDGISYHRGAMTPHVEPSPAPASEGGTASPAAGSGQTSLPETAANIAQKLKPVAAAAETLAGYAVNLSARGLNWLDTTLADRKRQRTAAGAEEPESVPAVEPRSHDPSI